MSALHRFGLGATCALLACAHPSGTSPATDVQVVGLRPPVVLAQARYTLQAMGYHLVAPPSPAAVWATAEVAGHSIVRCNESLTRRVVAPNPVLVIVTAQDTVAGSLVRVQVIGWRAGETPRLGVGMGTASPNGPCTSTGSLESDLFSVFRELARRTAPSNQ